jgi:hypothetical protein
MVDKGQLPPASSTIKHSVDTNMGDYKEVENILTCLKEGCVQKVPHNLPLKKC